jgi:hypothetical protein
MPLGCTATLLPILACTAVCDMASRLVIASAGAGEGGDRPDDAVGVESAATTSQTPDILSCQILRS